MFQVGSAGPRESIFQSLAVSLHDKSFHVLNNACNISLQPRQYLSYARACKVCIHIQYMAQFDIDLISETRKQQFLKIMEFFSFGNYFLYCLELSLMEFSETFSTCENGHKVKFSKVGSGAIAQFCFLEESNCRFLENRTSKRWN